MKTVTRSGAAATLPEVTHHTAAISGERLHYVTAGESGTPVLLVHGFPESWWAFRGVIPILSERYRVVAVDLPGFGDSGRNPQADYSSAFAAQCLHELIDRLGWGPVHLSGQDIGGVSTFRLAAGHPDLVRSLTAIETGLPGFGWEALADVTHGGVWHIGAIAAPGIPELLLSGRERQFLTEYALPAMSAGTGAITEQDVDELARAYARPGGFQGASGLYGSALAEGDELRRIVDAARLTMPVLSVAAGTGPFTHETMHAVAANVTEADLPGIGHLAALEDPDGLAEILLGFYATLDA